MSTHSDKPADNWERDTLEKVLLEAYREQKRARIWKLIFRLIVVLLFLLYLAAIFSATHRFDPESKQAHTAFIRLDGIISSENNQAAKLREGMEAAYRNPNVKGIVILANSPGGSPVVSNIAFDEIRRMKAEHPEIPVYAVAEDMCASGCYYIAAAADKIYADPASIIGSIGVIGNGFDLTGLMDKIGVQRRQRTAGSNKGMGDPFSPETPEQAAIWQAMLDDIHTQFITAVKTGRGERLNEKDHPDLFSGRIYTGREAVGTGLIDGTANVYTVAREMFNAEKLVDYTPKEGLSQTLGKNFGMQLRQGLHEAVQDRPW